MKEKLELKNLAPYLPYGLNILYWNGLAKEHIEILQVLHYENRHVLGSEKHKPILRPLSDLTKEINYGLSTYAFTYLFEIGDCDGCVFEFEHGNIKTIKALENISKYNSYNDINYLPNAVVNMMYEHHFDVFGLIEKGLAIDINTLKQKKLK